LDSPKLVNRPGWRPSKQKTFTWGRLFDQVTSPKLVNKTGTNNILLQRSSNPNYRFWIRLPANSTTFAAFPTNIKTWAETAVPNALISAKKTDKTGQWVSDKPADWNKYVFVSSSSKFYSLSLPCLKYWLTPFSFPEIRFICSRLGFMKKT
jgi:hypothetical protein